MSDIDKNELIRHINKCIMQNNKKLQEFKDTGYKMGETYYTGANKSLVNLLSDLGVWDDYY